MTSLIRNRTNPTWLGLLTTQRRINTFLLWSRALNKIVWLKFMRIEGSIQTLFLSTCQCNSHLKSREAIPWTKLWRALTFISLNRLSLQLKIRQAADCSRRKLMKVEGYFKKSCSIPCASTAPFMFLWLTTSATIYARSSLKRCQIHRSKWCFRSWFPTWIKFAWTIMELELYRASLRESNILLNLLKSFFTVYRLRSIRSF